MRVTPKTANEIAADGIWPAGVYDFQVESAEDTQSKNTGVDMIKLKVRIFNASGQSQTLFDYLLDAMPGKLRHAAEAFGLIAEYDAGGFEAIYCEGKTGQCKVKIDPEKGSYPSKNSIADYLPAKAGTQAAVRTMAATQQRAARKPGGGASIDSDEIPFSPCWQ